MTRLQTMSEPEKESWITFIADGLVFAWFIKVMLANWTSVSEARTPADLSEIYITLIVITIIYHAVISGFFELRRRKQNVAQDERDLAIQGEGAKAGYHALQFGVGLIVIIGLLSFVAGADYMAPVRIDTVVQFIFGLTAVSYVASLIKHGLVLLRYGAP